MVPKDGEDRILLVDDLALVRRLVPARLASLGGRVSAVASAAEARAFIEKSPPGLILLDVVLPGQDGLALCRELKADARFRSIPVLMFTDVGGNILERSLEAGADDYLPKRLEDAFIRIRTHLHLQLAELRSEGGDAVDPHAPVSLLLVTGSRTLGAQIQAQLQHPACRIQVFGSFEAATPAVTGQESLLIVDMSLDPDGIHEFLSQVRMNAESAGLPVLLLCDRQDLERLTDLEFMVDDVQVKPLTAVETRHRMKLLLEMSQRLARRTG